MMMKHDPLKDPYNRPYTDEEIKGGYIKFREAYYKELSDHANDRFKVNAILDSAKPVLWKTPSDTTGLDKLATLVKILVEENANLRRKYLEERNKPLHLRFIEQIKRILDIRIND